GRRNEPNRDRDVVTWHTHFLVLRQLDRTGHVRGTEVELGTIALEERRVTAAFFLGQDVDLGGEVGVRLDRTRLAQHLAALDVFALGAAQQNTDVVARLTLVKQLAEHFHARAGRLDGVLQAHDLDFLADLDDAALDTTGHDRATTRGREHVFDGHQDRAAHGALGRRDVAVQRSGQLADGLLAQLALVAVQRQTGRTGDDRGVVAREVVLREQFAHVHLDEL